VSENFVLYVTDCVATNSHEFDFGQLPGVEAKSGNHSELFFFSRLTLQAALLTLLQSVLRCNIILFLRTLL
jgi:hypothetical protein